jgi:hypothetical protein
MKGIMRTTIRFKTGHSILDTRHHTWTGQAAEACFLEFQQHCAATGEPCLPKKIKSMQEFKAAWAKNRNAHGDQEWNCGGEARVASANPQTPLAKVYGRRGSGVSIDNADEHADMGVDQTSCASVSVASPFAEVRPAFAQTPLSDDHEMGMEVDEENLDSASKADDDQEDEDDGEDPLAKYRIALCPIRAMVNGGLDGRVRKGAKRQSGVLDAEHGATLDNMIAQAELCCDLNAKDIPEMMHEKLQDLRKRVKAIVGTKTPITVQKALLARDSQDIINTSNWIRLTTVLNLFESPRELNVSLVRLSDLDCTVSQKVKIFKHILIKTLFKYAVSNARVSIGPLASVCKAFLAVFDLVDLIEADPALVACVEDFKSCFVGVQTLLDIEFHHETSEERYAKPPLYSSVGVDKYSMLCAFDFSHVYIQTFIRLVSIC